MRDTIIQLKTALAYYEVGKPEEAADLCEMMLRENPEDETVLEFLAMIAGPESSGGQATIDEALALNQAGKYGDWLNTCS